jgi:hypothetical protein
MQRARCWKTVTRDADQLIGPSAVGEGRVFVSLGQNYYYGCYDCSPDTSMPLLVLGGFESGQLAVGRVDVAINGPYANYISRMAAGGKRAVVGVGYAGGVSVVDASDAAAPRITDVQNFPGYVEDIAISGDTALLSLGYDGIRTLDLSAP